MRRVRGSIVLYQRRIEMRAACRGVFNYRYTTSPSQLPAGVGFTHDATGVFEPTNLIYCMVAPVLRTALRLTSLSLRLSTAACLQWFTFSLGVRLATNGLRLSSLSLRLSAAPMVRNWPATGRPQIHSAKWLLVVFRFLSGACIGN